MIEAAIVGVTGTDRGPGVTALDAIAGLAMPAGRPAGRGPSRAATAGPRAGVLLVAGVAPQTPAAAAARIAAARPVSDAGHARALPASVPSRRVPHAVAAALAVTDPAALRARPVGAARAA